MDVQKFGFFGETLAPENDEDPFNDFLGLLDMGPTSTRKHEWNFGTNIYQKT